MDRGSNGQMIHQSLELTSRMRPPAWAFWERYLIDLMSRAAVEFVQRYTRPDGTLIWREEWPGMDGSDDGYESFFNFPLLYLLGGAPELDKLAREEWEAITRQFSGYGQVYREFDAYYDWMHHGESSLLFYFFGLSHPDDARMVGRARRFAGMYTGEDPAAANYDVERKIIRSPITGSRGPRFINSAEDWVTHRPILAAYPPPFEDIPGVTGPTADWNDDGIFSQILGLMNDRMMSGDIPLNLTATSMAAHAFLYTGAEWYRDWVTGYTTAWKERARVNGGLLPDNVGPGGVIGERMEGKWWGGYYGWRWPHGWMNLVQPALIAASNALLLTGDSSYLELPRWQLEGVEKQGKLIEGQVHTPHRHGDSGWYDFRRPDASYAVYLWYLSMEEEDAGRAAEWAREENKVQDRRGKGDDTHTAAWYHFIQGANPGYPETILQVNYAEVCRRLEAIRNDYGDPEKWDVHHWQDLNPVVCEGLVQLTLGGPQLIYHGGLLHCRLRYFDPDRKRPGLPPEVAALVRRVDAEGIEVELVNLNPMEERRVILQAGSFAEHRFTSVVVGNSVKGGAGEVREAGKDVIGNQAIQMDSPYLEVLLAPACGGSLRFGMKRYANTPSYVQPV